MIIEIITPEKTVLNEEVDEVLVPTEKGQMGILPHHINLVTEITGGELIMKKNCKEKYFAVTGGFLQVHNNTISILADYAVHVDEIDIDKAIAAQKRAEEILKKGAEKVSEHDFAVASSEFRKSLVNITVAKRRRRRSGL